MQMKGFSFCGFCFVAPRGVDFPKILYLFSLSICCLFPQWGTQTGLCHSPVFYFTLKTNICGTSGGEFVTGPTSPSELLWQTGDSNLGPESWRTQNTCMLVRYFFLSAFFFLTQWLVSNIIAILHLLALCLAHLLLCLWFLYSTLYLCWLGLHDVVQAQK